MLCVPLAIILFIVVLSFIPMTSTVNYAISFTDAKGNSVGPATATFLDADGNVVRRIEATDKIELYEIVSLPFSAQNITRATTVEISAPHCKAAKTEIKSDRHYELPGLLPGHGGGSGGYAYSFNTSIKLDCGS